MGFRLEDAAEDHLLHDRVVRDVAEARFGLEDWDIVTNPGWAGDGALEGVAPDIVARHSMQVVAVGEVETIGTLSEERAELWKAFGQSCARFYLYVPEGTEEETARLIANHEIACAGLRSYSHDGTLTVRPVHIEGVGCNDNDHRWWVAIGGGDKIC